MFVILFFKVFLNYIRYTQFLLGRMIITWDFTNEDNFKVVPLSVVRWNYFFNSCTLSLYCYTMFTETLENIIGYRG